MLFLLQKDVVLRCSCKSTLLIVASISFQATAGGNKARWLQLPADLGTSTGFPFQERGLTPYCSIWNALARQAAGKGWHSR